MRALVSRLHRREARDVARACPGATVWYGQATRSWWAMVPGINRLIEAESSSALAMALLQMSPRPAPAVAHRRQGLGGFTGAPARLTSRTPAVSRVGAPPRSVVGAWA